MTSKEELYEMLLSQYKLARERTDGLINRAHALLGFSGIVNAILVALIMGVTKEETRIFLIKYINLPLLHVVVILSFAFYVASMVFSLFAYATTRYMPVPQLDSKEFIEDIFSGKAELSKKHISLQIVDAIEFYDKINNRKYTYLLLSTVFLFFAIVFTAIIGIFLFLSIR